MRILWVKAGGLVPLDSGGRLRSYHILRELAHRHEITFFTFYAEQAKDPHSELGQIFNHVEAIPLKLPAARSLKEGLWYARNVFADLPHTILKFCQPEVRRRLRTLVKGISPEIIVCDFIFPAAAIPWDSRCPTIVFTHNVEAQIWQRHYQTARNPVWRLVTRREYHAMERAEQTYLKRADHVLTVSEPDRDFFARFVDPSKITVIPTGVDTDFFRPQFGDAKPKRLVFTGSMDWMPNEDGIIHFVHEVLPLIRQQEPDTRLSIVGRKPSAKLKALEEVVPGIEVTGRVDDIRPYVHEAAVYIVPLRIGGGTRLKIFEAMAMGKAVVSTTIGAEGLPVKDQKDILLADDPAQFGNAVLRLLRSHELRSQLGLAARNLVENGFGWPSVGARFGDVLEKVVLRKHALLPPTTGAEEQRVSPSRESKL